MISTCIVVCARRRKHVAFVGSPQELAVPQNLSDRPEEFDLQNGRGNLAGGSLEGG